jgi:hypothetical protein
MATGQRNLGMVDRSGIALTAEAKMNDGFNVSFDSETTTLL